MEGDDSHKAAVVIDNEEGIAMVLTRGNATAGSPEIHMDDIKGGSRLRGVGRVR